MFSKISRRITAVVILMSWVFSAMPVHAGTLEDQISQAESAEIQMADQKAEALDQCAKIGAELEEINSSIEKYQIQIDYKVEELDSLNEDYNKARLQKEERYEAIRELFGDKLTGVKSLGAILFKYQKNSMKIKNSGITDGMSSSDKDKINSYLDLCEEIKQEEKRIKKEQKELEALKKPYDKEKQKLQELMIEKENLISYLEEALGATDDSLAQLKAELEAYNIAQAQRETIRQGLNADDGSLKGMFIDPCPDGNLCSDYGYREDGFHKGIDLKCDVGSPIYAALDGVVTISGVSSSAGNWIVVDHGNGLTTKYMHCSERYVSAGDTVTQGQLIAAVGCTGSTSTPHLHFQVEFEGSNYNPWNFL